MRPFFHLSRATSLLLFCAFEFSPLSAQEGLVTSDTLASRVTTADTGRRVTGIDTLVVYKARDSITYSLRTRYMNLYGTSDIKYRAIDLKAEQIGVNWDNATLTAEGIPDTSDKTGKKYIGEPVLKDGGETYDGFKIGYNFQTKKGKISLAETEIEEGYYHGEEIKKVGPDILFVEDGRYTTCSADHPHFYFYSPRMKVIPREVVVAEPVYFYIADVPIFALPFGVFPNKSGRRSGLIAPAFGEDERLGRYFSHFGYYWAISDYLDFASTFDWYTRGGWGNRSMLRYNLRYNFSGSISASVNHKNLNGAEPGDPDYNPSRDYNIGITHDQPIDPTARLLMNVAFMTSSYYRNVSTNYNQILTQNVISTANFSKSWPESNRSLSLYVSRDQSLVNGGIEETLPQLTFNQSSIFPFRRKAKGTGDQAWFETIGLNYRANLGNRRSKQPRVVTGVKDTTGGIVALSEFRRASTQSIEQAVGFSFSPRFGNFTVSPSLGFSDNRSFLSDRSPALDPVDSVLIFQSSRSKSTSGNLNAGLGFSTRFFGIMQPNVLGVTAFRHTVNPSLSFGYGKQIYGTTVGRSSMTANFSVQNLFEMKYQPSDTAKEQKIQLMNIGANVSYNFRAPELRLSELGVSYRTEIGQYLKVNGSASYNFYLFDRALGRRVNKFLINEKRYLADLTSVSLSLSTSLSGERKSGGEVEQPQEDVQQSGVLGQEQFYGMQGYDQDLEPDFSIPWSLNLNLNFSQSQPDPRQKFRSVSLQAQLSFNLTEQWKISASGNYDLVRKEFAAPIVNVSRDLHCWIMNFTWIPIGPYRYYRLEIRVKAPTLQDIKITKQGSERGVY